MEKNLRAAEKKAADLEKKHKKASEDREKEYQKVRSLLMLSLAPLPRVLV